MKSKKDFFHFVPYVNGMDFLRRAIHSVPEFHENLIIIDNRNDLKQPDPAVVFKDLKIKILKPEVPLTTAQTMNLMLKRANDAGHKFFTWMHHDAEAQKGNGQQMLDIVRKLYKNKVKWGIVYTTSDVMAAYNIEALNAVGGWDWIFFPYYWLDNDVHQAVVAAGYQIIDSGIHVWHNGPSMTIQNDEKRFLYNSLTFHACKILFSHKWGADKLPKKSY